MSNGGDSDHTDSERSVGSLENRKHCIKTTLSLCHIPKAIPGDAELVSMTDRLAVVKSEGAPSIPDSAISLGRSSTITRTTAGVTQFSEVSYTATMIQLCSNQAGWYSIH